MGSTPISTHHLQARKRSSWPFLLSSGPRFGSFARTSDPRQQRRSLHRSRSHRGHERLPGLQSPQAGVSLTACVLSPLLFRASLSLLFFLPNIHYSSSHSSLAHLCPPPPLNCNFSVSSSPWLPYLHSQPRLTVALSWPRNPLPPLQCFFPTAQGRAFHEHWPDLHTMFALSWKFRAKQEQGQECSLWPWLAVSKPRIVLCV